MLNIPPQAPQPARDFDGCAAPTSVSGPYQDLLARFKREAVPYSVLWEMTHVCNLDCIMCYNVPEAQPELSTAEAFALLDQLAAAGTLRLTLSGGEILSRRDFFDIAEYARKLGFALTLKTNGTLITNEKADRIAALAPEQVDISLLGATKTTFDAIARSRNTLERVLRGVKLLQERGIRVKLNTLLMDLNLDERAEMVELASSLGVLYEQVFKISPADDASDRAGEHQLSRVQITQALVEDHSSFTLRSRTLESRTCSVGLSSCLISPYGDVYPCIELRITAGNIRQQSFDEIWRTAPIFQELRSRHTLKSLPDCQTCALNPYCEGRCSGLAWKEHGDLYGGHLLACQQAQARYAQFHPGEPIPLSGLQTRIEAGEIHPVSPTAQSIPLIDILSSSLPVPISSSVVR